jgi:hypothetical protein
MAIDGDSRPNSELGVIVADADRRTHRENGALHMSSVFVSSTCHDLVDLRAEVEEHLRALGLTPVMSDRLSAEFEVPGNRTSIETCLINVGKADVFICLLSQRYGPTLEAIGYPDKSATHIEWDAARGGNGPRVLCYARDRLLGDWQVWKDNGRSTTNLRLRWTQDERLLSFLDEIKSLGPKNLNWVWPFRDSIELKARLAKDLARDVAAARISNLTRDGALPVLVIDAKARLADGHLSFSIANYHHEPALRAHIDIIDDYEGRSVTGAPRSCAVISSERPWEMDIVVRCLNTQLNLTATLSYETRFGDRIAEQFLLAVHGPSETSVHLMDRRWIGKAHWTVSPGG